MRKTPSNNLSTKEPPIKRARVVHEISSTESSPVKPTNDRNLHHPIKPIPKRIVPTKLPIPNTTIPPRPNNIISTKPSPLVPRAISFTSPQSSPHLYNLEDLPPRPSHPLPPTTFSSLGGTMIQNQGVESTLAPASFSPFPSYNPIWIMRNHQSQPPDHMEVDTSLPPSSFLIEPFLNGPPPIPPSFEAPQTASIDPLNQATSFHPPPLPSHDKDCYHCQHVESLIHEVREDQRFMFYHLLERFDEIKPKQNLS